MNDIIIVDTREKGHKKILEYFNSNNIDYIVSNTPEESIIFVTGVGKVYPLVRSHTVLNSLHQKLYKVPVIMFFPGEYTGQKLNLFNAVTDDNYYRAFPLCK